MAALEPETDDDGAPLPGSPMAVEAIVLDRAWARDMLQRATQKASIAGVELPLVDLADLVVLKAYAGGPIDRAEPRSATGSGGCGCSTTDARAAGR